MRARMLIIVGSLIVAGGLVGLIHPQWQGRDKKTDVTFGDKHYVVNTRRIVRLPVGFCVSIMIMGGCTVGLGAITRAKARQAQK